MAGPVFGGRWQQLLLAVLLVLAGGTASQRTQNCSVHKSQLSEDKVDVHCNCMQRLSKMNQPIDRLVINQTGCSETGLQLKWRVLETQVAPKTLVLSGAQVFFFSERQTQRAWDSSIVRLSFVDCSFNSLPPYAFAGLNLLEEVRILGGSVDAIESNAFSGHRSLRVVEIANVTVGVIESLAFNDLPSLEDLAVVNSTVDAFESEAVLLRQASSEEDPKRCSLAEGSPTGRTSLSVVMGRQLNSTGDLPLPEYGSRLLLFKNAIRVVRSRAVASETLGFLIAGGNVIEDLQSGAFSMELHNDCEISAALFIGNDIANLRDSALAGLKGRDGASYQTFVALANNAFHTVSRDGFLLSEGIEIFSIGTNSFRCACDALGWILGNADSRTPRELEKEVVQGAVCLDGSSLISFTSSCTDNGTTAADTATPTSPTASPTVQTARPTVLTARPTVQTARPTVQTAQPTVQTPRPTVQTPRPTVQTARPKVHTPEPPRPSSAPASSLSVISATVSVLALAKALM